MRTLLKRGEEVTINIPFTYTIGEEGYHSEKVLLTAQDCIDEVRAEIDNGILNASELSIEVAD